MEPLAPSWREWTLARQRAGARSTARLVLVNDGSATWRSRGSDGLQLSYHWLDTRGNAIAWDGLRTPFPHPVAPGEAIELDAPIEAPQPPGRYLLRFDLENETETIRHYRERVRQCESLGEFAMAEQIRGILVNEQDHQIELATALGEDVPDNSG